MKGLSSGDVDSISQGCNDKSWAIAKILITVAEDSIGNLEDIISNEAIPIRLELRLPLELIRICDLLISQLRNDITRVGVHGDHAHNFHTHASGELTLHHLN